MKRKGNPLFGLGRDRLGRRSWRRKPDRGNVDDAGLRAGLQQIDTSGEIPVSKLPPQPSSYQVNSFTREVKGLTRQLVDERSRGPLAMLTLPASLASMSFAFFGLPVVSLPLAAFALTNILIAPLLRRRRARRQAERKVLTEYGDIMNADAYRSEAGAFAGAYPRWGGPHERYESGEVIDVDSGMELRFAVDERGLGEVVWGYVGDEGEGRGWTVLAYPGANLSKHIFEYPVRLPGVNLRNADLSGMSLMRDGSVLDGADLRDVNAERAALSASLVGANLSGANLREANLLYCDLSGANLQGADLTGALLPVDLSEVDLTREQFDSLALPPIFTALSDEPNEGYRVKEVSVDDLVALYGGDRDAATMALWTGEVEVRERGTNEVVTGEFDPDEHYIPSWALNTQNTHR